MNGFSLAGELHLKIFEEGLLIEDSVQHNVVTYIGLDSLLASFLKPESSTPGNRYNSFISKAVFGTGATNPGDPTFSTFTSPLLVDLTGVESSIPQDFGRPRKVSFTLGSSEGNGMTIREMGLWITTGELSGSGFTPTTGNDRPFNRIVRAPIVKTSAITVQGTWIITAYVKTL